MHSHAFHAHVLFALVAVLDNCAPRRMEFFAQCRSQRIVGAALTTPSLPTAHVRADAPRVCDDDQPAGARYVLLHATGTRRLSGGALDSRPYGICYGGHYVMDPTPWTQATTVCVTDVAEEVLRRVREVLPPERAFSITDTPCGRINGPAHPDNVYTLLVSDADAVSIAVAATAATLEELGIEGSFAVAVWPRSCLSGPPPRTPRVRDINDQRSFRRN